MIRQSLRLLASVCLLGALAGLATAGEGPSLEWSPEPLPLSDAEFAALCQSARNALADAEKPFAAVPLSLKNDTAMRAVFLLKSDGKTTAQSGLGFGAGIVAATRDAAARIKAAAPEAAPGAPVWVMIEIVQKSVFLPDLRPDAFLARRPTLRGIALDWQARHAWLPQETVMHKLMHARGHLQLSKFTSLVRNVRGDPARLRSILGRRPVAGARFLTSAACYDGQRMVRLYRGHRMWTRITREDLRRAATYAGNYLVAATRDDGAFVYRYDPVRDRASKSYNILRHAGTLMAMLDLYALTGDKALLAAARGGLDYLQTRALPFGAPEENMACVVKPDGSVPLGGAALAVVAFAKYQQVTGDKAYAPVMTRLGNYIVACIRADGSFISKRAFTTGRIDPWLSEYYPGEALLGLVRLHESQPDDKWLEAAERGAKWLINVRDRNTPPTDLIHDHWLLYALNELHQARPRQVYVEHSLRIARTIAMSQAYQAEFPDWVGGYDHNPRATPAATRNEGLLSTYALLRRTGKNEEAAELMETIHLGIAFQLQLQMLPETAMFMPRPERALVGVRGRFDEFQVRIDQCQHFMSAVLMLHRVLEKERRTELAMPKAMQILTQSNKAAFPWRKQE